MNKRMLAALAALALLVAACGHRTALTLPNAKGKPPAERSQPDEAEQP